MTGKKKKKPKASAEAKEGVDAEAAAPEKATVTDGAKSTKGIRFMDEEYPTLATESKGKKLQLGIHLDFHSVLQ